MDQLLPSLRGYLVNSKLSPCYWNRIRSYNYERLSVSKINQQFTINHDQQSLHYKLAGFSICTQKYFYAILKPTSRTTDSIQIRLLMLKEILVWIMGLWHLLNTWITKRFYATPDLGVKLVYSEYRNNITCTNIPKCEFNFPINFDGSMAFETEPEGFVISGLNLG